jgi:protein-S-isoprenylcysteine O-methyltransferase Ste14
MLKDIALHQTLIWIYLAFAAMAFAALFFIAAPYGRHRKRRWGPEINPRLGWVLMEAPAAVVFAGFLMAAPPFTSWVPWIFGAMWMTHYLHRSSIFPLRMKRGVNDLPVLVVALGIFHNLQSGALNGWWVGTLGTYTNHWVSDPRFIGGLALFSVGFIIHLLADEHLRSLRDPHGDGYSIPRGILNRWISCPNYLGEMLQWLGWALCTWSFAGLAFFLFTVANLLPRALAHHRWYRQTFPDYPATRKALIPYVL